MEDKHEDTRPHKRPSEYYLHYLFRKKRRTTIFLVIVCFHHRCRTSVHRKGAVHLKTKVCLEIKQIRIQFNVRDNTIH